SGRDRIDPRLDLDGRMGNRGRRRGGDDHLRSRFSQSPQLQRLDMVNLVPADADLSLRQPEHAFPGCRAEQLAVDAAAVAQMDAGEPRPALRDFLRLREGAQGQQDDERFHGSLPYFRRRVDTTLTADWGLWMKVVVPL